MEIRIVTHSSDIVIVDELLMTSITIYSIDLNELDEIGKNLHRAFYTLRNPLTGDYVDHACRSAETDKGYIEVNQNKIDDKCFFVTNKLIKNLAFNY